MQQKTFFFLRLSLFLAHYLLVMALPTASTDVCAVDLMFNVWVSASLQTCLILKTWERSVINSNFSSKAWRSPQTPWTVSYHPALLDTNPKSTQCRKILFSATMLYLKRYLRKTVCCNSDGKWLCFSNKQRSTESQCDNLHKMVARHQDQ